MQIDDGSFQTTCFQYYDNKYNAENRREWEDLMEFDDVAAEIGVENDPSKDYISASATKAYILKDPLLDWLKKYHHDLGFNTEREKKLRVENPALWADLRKKRGGKDRTESSTSTLKLLFEKGNEFEARVNDVSYDLASC